MVPDVLFEAEGVGNEHGTAQRGGLSAELYLVTYIAGITYPPEDWRKYTGLLSEGELEDGILADSTGRFLCLL